MNFRGGSEQKLQKRNDGTSEKWKCKKWKNETRKTKKKNRLEVTDEEAVRM